MDRFGEDSVMQDSMVPALSTLAEFWQNLDVLDWMRAWEAWKRANPTSWVHQLAIAIDTLALEGAECRGVGHRATARVAEELERRPDQPHVGLAHRSVPVCPHCL